MSIFRRTICTRPSNTRQVERALTSKSGGFVQYPVLWPRVAAGLWFLLTFPIYKMSGWITGNSPQDCCQGGQTRNLEPSGPGHFWVYNKHRCEKGPKNWCFWTVMLEKTLESISVLFSFPSSAPGPSYLTFALTILLNYLVFSISDKYVNYHI